MFRFSSASFYSELPKGFILDRQQVPSAQALNRLLSKSCLETHAPQKLCLALKNSDFHLSIFQLITGNLAGFVRVTSDKGLNANLWDLVAEPGENQEKLIAVLVYRALHIIKKELPGCSISVAAPNAALEALKAQGFIIDPNGIRVMGFRLR